MKSIRELYTIGRGPSSSHTMGPARAAALFRSEHPEADHFRVVLYGSLALTGRGHLTDQAVREALDPVDAEIVFDSRTGDLPHPNTMDLFACRDGAQTGFCVCCPPAAGLSRWWGGPMRLCRKCMRKRLMLKSRPGAKATMPDCPIMWSVTKENIFGMIYIACGKP